MRKNNGVINFIIANKYKILLIILYLLFALQMQNVYMYADDYSIMFPDSSNVFMSCYYLIIGFIKAWSGRFVGHSVVLLGMNFFGIQFFRILNLLFLFMTCYFVTKIINIKKQNNFDKILFFVSNIFIGLDISITSQIFYWAYGTILYLWSCLPLFSSIYFILDYYINNSKITNKRFILILISIFIINFSMESIAVCFTVFLFLQFVSEYKNNKNRKVLIILIYSIFLLGVSFFIPGNLTRLGLQYNYFNKLNIFGRIAYHSNTFICQVVAQAGISKILVCLSSMLILYGLKNLKYFYNKVLLYLLIILNIIIVTNYSFELFDESKYLFFSILCYIYFAFNAYVLISALIKSEAKSFIFLSIGGICSVLVPIILIMYLVHRFYILLIINFIILCFYLFLKLNKKQQCISLIIFVFSINYFIGIVMLLIFLYATKKKILIDNLYCISCILFVTLNFFTFFKTMYYYNENAKIFKYNIEKIINHNNDSKKITLKKLVNEDYAYDMPENYDYVEEWYMSYYNLDGIKIYWE